MMRRSLPALMALALSVSVVACGAEQGPPDLDVRGANDPEGTGANGGIVIGPDGVPVGPDGQPLPPKLDGLYEISNYFDLTSAGVFPDPVNDTLGALSSFRETPSQTIVDLLDAAGVPVVPRVLNSIPSLIRGYVLGWVDEHLFKALYQKVPVMETITGLLDDLASITTKFELVTVLDLPEGDGIGDAQATHTVSGMAYMWSEKRNVLTAPEAIANLTAQDVKANAVALEKLSSELETARLALGEHRFSVPVGSFALLAADRLVKDKFGAENLREALGKIVDCKAVAKNVASRCIDPIGPGKICVGRETELEMLCNTGLGAIVSAVQDQIRKLDLPLLRLENGQAQMWDALAPGEPLDAVVDRIDMGFWSAKVNAGKQEKAILATFKGRRIGDSAGPR
jgi:hypothetical protein